ncbi:class II aldolase/adducin family protein [Candidatus Finniella inopinata]|uniref:Class II aldolase/adducin N-terminal domain-containing protein n=1 Tax=Candidatus Finniella inopinata TaxID=1696036 RepID=A0A4Q7DLB5_9PROT|nr:class II aldolase/adducin family protein [Candidatus Finniella inopinata]RZI47139.1 hypothetical protein EQU50_00720 [Candidatus Finniella inopinata]
MNSIKQNLAIAYRVLAHLGLDDHTYTHLSARSEDGDSYYIYPFGLRFEEVTPELLLRVSFDGVILEGTDHTYNPTGYLTHGSLYKKRPDINAIFHVHTPAIVAVSALEEGLLPLSQWALHFYGRMAYHSYDSLLLDQEQGARLTQDLGNNYVMLMRHHGALISGRTIQETMFYTYHLYQACQTQCMLLSMQRSLIFLDEATCLQASKDLLSFEKDLGSRDWEAWERLVSLNFI